jgi:NHS family nucleoside permease-like MFS transporter
VSLPKEPNSLAHNKNNNGNTSNMTTYTRLKAMMFLEYGIFACMAINSYYFINVLELSGSAAGILLSCFGIGMLFSSAITSKVVGKHVREVTLFKVLHLVSAFAFIGITFVTDFTALFPLFLLYSLFLAPTMGLSNSITFRLIEDQDHYGKIRVWGTIGFVFFAWFLSWFINRYFPGHINYVYFGSGVIGLVLVAFMHFAFADDGAELSEDKNKASFQFSTFFTKRILALLVVIDLTALMLQKFFFLALGPNLGHLGVAEVWIMPINSVNQFVEVFVLLSLSWLVAKTQKLNIIFAGMLIHVIVFSVLWQQSIFSLIMATAMYGFIYPFILATAQMVLDDNVDEAHRASMHQVYLLLTIGIADLFGNWLAGYLYEILEVQAGNYELWWGITAVAAMLSLLLAVVFKIRLGKSSEAMLS